MRQLFKAFLVVAVLSAPLAFAQSDEDESNPGDEPTPEGSATVVNPKPAATSGKASSPGTQHTVEKGDTLWDLSQRYLGSPWYWPKVWSYNPEIANPHWIYPGNEVRFFGSGEEVPTQVEAGAPETQVQESELYDDVNVAGQIGYRPKNGVTVISPGFITTREVEASGKLIGSFAESDGLTYPAHIYVDFGKKAPRLGEIYLVFHSGGEVIHPVTQSPMGFITRILGEVKVIRVDKDNHGTVQIWKQYDEIARGDLIGPMTEPVTRLVAARPNERDIKGGIVVGDVRLHPTSMAEHQLVIIDRGADDGVKTGNTFTIYRQHDPSTFEALLSPMLLDERFPTEDVGTCIAFEIKAKATVCLMSHSMREINKGDHVEIRASGGRRASR